MGAAALGMHWGWPFPCQSQEQFPGPAWLGFTLQGWIQPRGTWFTPSEVPRVTLLQHLQHSLNPSSASSFRILFQQLQSLQALSSFLPSSCFLQFRCAPAELQVSPFTGNTDQPG